MISRISILIAVAAWGSACAPRVLPQATRPARLTPRLPAPPAQPTVGRTRVMIDVVDGPTRVELVQEFADTRPGVAVGGVELFSGPTSRTLFQPLCLAPCVVDLVPGVYRLNFVRGDAYSGQVDPGGLGLLEVKKDPVVYRRSLGVHHPRSRGELTLGVLGVIAGPVAMISGLGEDEEDRRYGFTIGGALLTGLAVYLMYDSREVVQAGHDLQFFYGR